MELIAGQKYGIRIGTPEGEGAHLRIWKPNYFDYLDGERLENEIEGIDYRPQDDIFFRVMVSPITEPTLPGMVAVLAAMFCLSRKRRIEAME